jgi:hypothetical protein
MSFRNNRGQTLVESVGALSLLFLIFFTIYYIFLLSLDKIRSLDTVYHLARYQQVHATDNFDVHGLDIDLKCFGRIPYVIPQPNNKASSGPAVKEVVFRYANNFGPSFLLPHTSVMRVAQPNPDYLTKSYLGAREDADGLALSGTLEVEKGELIGLAHLDADSVVDQIGHLGDLLKEDGG